MARAKLTRAALQGAINVPSHRAAMKVFRRFSKNQHLIDRRDIKDARVDRLRWELTNIAFVVGENANDWPG